MPETFEQAFNIPGAAFTITVAFLAAFMVSMKAPVWWQVGLAVFFTLYFTDSESMPLARMWVCAGWAGFLFEKLGLWYGIVAIVNGIKVSLQSAAMGRRRTTNSWRFDSENTRRGSTDEREKGYERANAEYAQRERQRNKEATKRAEEKAEQARKDAERAKEKAAKKMKDFFQKERRGQSETNQSSKKKKVTPPLRPTSAPKNSPLPRRESSPKPPPIKKGYWFDVLDVPSSASLIEIKKAWRKKVNQYHPDKLQNFSEKERKHVEEDLKIINDAYETGKKRRK